MKGEDYYFRKTDGDFGNIERFGSPRYGHWSLLTDCIGQNSVVYSFGVGEDASFDLELINRYGLCIQAFDPTPKSIKWVRAQCFGERFVLHEYGLAAVDGEVMFNPPENPEHVSYTMLDRPSTCDQAIHVPVKRLKSIMKILGHTHIDILKIDIEGAEYDVIDDMCKCNICPEQILVEFHHRFPFVGIAKTRRAVALIKEMEYALINVSSSGEEFSFVRKKRI